MLEGVRWMSVCRARVVRGRGVLALVALGLTASPASAAPPASSDMSVADLDRNGREAVREQRFEAARDYYRDAYLRERSTARLWNLALAQLAAHDSVFALLSLRQYESAPDAEPRRKALVEQLIADAYGETGHLAFSGEATVILDGETRAVGRDIEVDVPVGDHTVAWSPASAPIHVHAPAGTVVSVDLSQIPRIANNLTPSATPVAPAPTKRAAKWPVTIGFGAAALAAAGGGVAFTLLSQQRFNQSVAQRESLGLPDWYCTVNGWTSVCQTLAHNKRVYDGELTASRVVYGTAGAFAVTATLVGALWRHSDKDPSASAWVLPMAGPGTIGAAAGANF